MKKTLKKGFTIVELVIVIAVVAILAAVLIPTYISLIKKANLSNDQQTVRNMNVSLATQVIPDTKFANAGDAVNALYLDGWNLGKMSTYSTGFHYAYNHEDNKMYLVDDAGEVVYPDKNVDKSKLYGLYNGSASAKIDGVIKYIALDNIVNGDDFGNLVNGGSYTIDLSGHFFGVDSGSYENVTLVNGVILDDSATVGKEENIVKY